MSGVDMHPASHRLRVLSGHLFPCSESTLHALPCAGESRPGVLAGQVAIITGSGQGIGAATARLFAREGCKVVVSDLDVEKSKAVADDITRNGGSAISVPGNVTDPEFPARILKATIDAFGKINILVNNAGYTWDRMLHLTSDEQWEAMHSVHETAPFRMIRAAAPYMREPAKKELEAAVGGKPKFTELRSIINVSSTSGIHGNVGQANYATAKMGVVGLTKTVAKEWGRFGIRCNAVAFGLIETRLTAAKEEGAAIKVNGQEVKLGIPTAGHAPSYAHIPLGRPGHPEEAAGAILFLAGPHSAYVSGHCLEVTGGYGI